MALPYEATAQGSSARQFSLTYSGLGGDKSVAFMLLNPKSAGVDADGPTMRRCIEFAKRFEADELTIIYLYPIVTPTPQVLWRNVNVGFDTNNIATREVCGEADLVIAAWGAEGSRHAWGHQTATRLRTPRGPYGGTALHHLGLTTNGQPRHPLYLPKDAPLTEWLQNERNEDD